MAKRQFEGQEPSKPPVKPIRNPSPAPDNGGDNRTGGAEPPKQPVRRPEPKT